MRFRPGKRFFASSQAKPEPAIKAINVAAVATANESRIGNQLIIKRFKRRACYRTGARRGNSAFPRRALRLCGKLRTPIKRRDAGNAKKTQRIYAREALNTETCFTLNNRHANSVPTTIPHK